MNKVIYKEDALIAIIKPGDPDCIHHEVISSPAYGEHMVGTCRKCGRVIDYTVLQQRCPQLRNDYLLDGGITMATIVKNLVGNGKKKKTRKQAEASRGRVCRKKM